jgi:hypothetical protein
MAEITLNINKISLIIGGRPKTIVKYIALFGNWLFVWIFDDDLYLCFMISMVVWGHKDVRILNEGHVNHCCSISMFWASFVREKIDIIRCINTY